MTTLLLLAIAFWLGSVLAGPAHVRLPPRTLGQPPKSKDPDHGVH